MTLEQLRILSRIVDMGTIKAAAQSLHKTQPALTMAIKKLESEYGFEILDRSQYRLSLTPAGKAFYRKSMDLLLSADQLRSMGQHLGEGNEPVIKLAYDLSCPHALVFTALEQVQQHYPNTEVHLLAESRFRALELVQQGEVDLAITPWWPTFYALGDIDTLTIGAFELILVVPPSLLQGEVISKIEQLKPYFEISIEESDMKFDSEKLRLLQGGKQWKTRDPHTLKQMLLAGLGWGLLPRYLIEQELLKGQLIQVQLEDMESAILGEVRIVRKENQTLGPVASLLWQSFCDAAIN